VRSYIFAEERFSVFSFDDDLVLEGTAPTSAIETSIQHIQQSR